MEEDETLLTDAKYKSYVTSIEKSLKSFEYSSEWPDLISALTKLNKVISGNGAKYGTIPKKLLLSKRLAQCLHPSLPSGVHLKALESYDLIFKAIGNVRLSQDIYIYCTGLFPLWSYANINVRTVLLSIYESHFVPLGSSIRPALDGFLHAIFSGIDDTSDYHERTIQLLKNISENVTQKTFSKSLWTCINLNKGIRQSATNYLLEYEHGNYSELQVKTLMDCLKDENILVQRSSLEFILKYYQLDVEYEYKKDLIKASLYTLLRRDMSLNRRLFSWLLHQVDYNNVKTILIESLEELLLTPTAEIFRIIVSLIDKEEVDLLEDIFFKVLKAFMVFKESEEFYKTGSLFFSNILPPFFNGFLNKIIRHSQEEGEENDDEATEAVKKDEVAEEIVEVQEIELGIDKVEEQQTGVVNEENGEEKVKEESKEVDVNENIEKNGQGDEEIRIATEEEEEMLEEVDEKDKVDGILEERKEIPKVIKERRYTIADVSSVIIFCIEEIHNFIEIEKDAITETVNEKLMGNLEEMSSESLQSLLRLLKISVPNQKFLNIYVKYNEVLYKENQLNYEKLLRKDTIALQEEGKFWSEFESYVQNYVSLSSTCDATFTEFKFTINCDTETYKLMNDLLLILNSNQYGKWNEMLLLSCCQDNYVMKLNAIETFIKLNFDNSLFKNTYVIENITRSLWENCEYEILTKLHPICRKVEKTVITYLNDVPNFNKLVYMKGVFENCTLKFLDNLISTDIRLKTQAECYCVKMISNNFDNVKIIIDPLLKILLDEKTQRVNICKFNSDAKATSNPDISNVNIPLTKCKSFNDFKKLYPIHPYQTHMQIYKKIYDHSRIIYALDKLHILLKLNPKLFLISLSTTSLSDSTIIRLLNSHSNSLKGVGFVNSSNFNCMYLEVVLKLLLNYSVSFSQDECEFNFSVICKALFVLGEFIGELGAICSDGFLSFVADVLSKIKLNKVLLHSLLSSLTDFTIPELTYSEEIVKLNYGNDVNIIQIHLLRLTTNVLKLEDGLEQTDPSPSQNMNKYVYNLRFAQQPLFLNCILNALKTNNPYWCNMIVQSLPYFKSSLTQIVMLTVNNVCKNLEISTDVDYINDSLDSLISITHWVLMNSSNEVKNDKKNESYFYSLITSFFPSTKSYEVVNSDYLSQAKDDLLSILDKIISISCKLRRNLKVYELINPLAHNYVNNFVAAIKLIEVDDDLVELVYSMKVIRLETITNVVNSIKNDNVLVFYKLYLIKFENLNDLSINSIVSTIKDINSPEYAIIMVEVLNTFCTKKLFNISKSESKEVQDVSQKLLEFVAVMAGNVDSNWMKRRKVEGFDDFSVDSLICLRDFLPSIVDCLWGGHDEFKEKILPVMTHICYHVMGAFKMRRTLNYKFALELIARLSSYAYLRKSWKKEIFEICLENAFFQFEIENLPSWKIIVDNLFTQDKSTFSELITRVTVPQTGSLSLFSSKEKEYEERAMLLKRLAFVIWCSEKDQFIKFFTNIQERLAEALKIPQIIVPSIQSSVFLSFRVMLLRFSSCHLTALWPIILHEVVQVLLQMEKDVNNETITPQWLQLYLQTCKLLELALTLPSDLLPIFQMYRWTFTNDEEEFFTPHITRLANSIPKNLNPKDEPLIATKINELCDLSDSFSYMSRKHSFDEGLFSHIIDCDFVE